MVPRLLGWPEDQIRERVINLLTVMGLPPEGFAAKRPAQLSGGQAQRVGLARAMAANPPVILMDEPFGALDGVTRSRLREEFTGLREWQEKTIVLVTHDVTEAFLLADRIALMDRGTVQQIDVPEKLLLHPANDFVRKFFDHQRLQLTLMVKPLRELMPGLSWLPESAPEAPVVKTSASLWEALETLQASGARTVGIRDGEVTRYIHRRDLLAAAFDPA
jgi:osmoprotectant transport system ATP-binding protein